MRREWHNICMDTPLCKSQPTQPPHHSRYTPPKEWCRCEQTTVWFHLIFLVWRRTVAQLVLIGGVGQTLRCLVGPSRTTEGTYPLVASFTATFSCSMHQGLSTIRRPVRSGFWVKLLKLWFDRTHRSLWCWIRVALTRATCAGQGQTCPSHSKRHSSSFGSGVLAGAHQIAGARRWALATASSGASDGGR